MPLDPQRLPTPAAGDPLVTWSLDLQAVLDHTGPAHLVGWSFGCTVISAWLRSAAARPWWESPTTQAVLSCASNALGPADSTDPVARLATETAVSDVIHCAAPNGAPAYARRMLAVGKDVAEFDPHHVQLLERSATQADERAVAAALVPFDDRGYWRDLRPDRKRRIHVLAAELDQFFDLAALTDCWAPAGLEITVIDGAPHAAPLTQTDKYAQFLLGSALPTKEKP